MKTIYKHLISGVLLTCAVAGFAQQEASRSAYFLDGYTFRHNLNPAFGGEYNYVSIPGIANIGVAAQSNVGLSDFIYEKSNGQLTTFMNSSVNAESFLSGLQSSNKITSNINLTLASAGFKGFNGFNTVSLSVRANLGVALPYDLFKFMKVGQDGDNTNYDLGGIRVNAKAYGELALGHQHQVSKDVSVGGKLKVLLGAGYVDANIDRMDVSMNDERWQIVGKGQLNMAAGKGLIVPTNAEVGKRLDRPQRSNQISFDDIDYDNFNLTGFGLGIDMGVVWDMHKFVKGLKVSASLLDLGFLKWNNAVTAATPETTWSFGGFQEVAVDSGTPNYEDNKIGTQFDNMKDSFIDCMNFQRTGVGASKTTALNATMLLGAEYEMPFYKGLTAGFLYTQYFAGPFSSSEGRFSANVKPTKWFDATINYGASNFGSSFGWMLNFHPRGVNFFIGSDHQFFKVNKQFIPVGKASAAINLGISVTFGARKG
jgi:hypothetical protein